MNGKGGGGGARSRSRLRTNWAEQLSRDLDGMGFWEACDLAMDRWTYSYNKNSMTGNAILQQEQSSRISE